MGVDAILQQGEVEVLGLLPYSSNYTFLARLRSRDSEAYAVYKPNRGERPLWDFPSGTLAARELAAYRVSEVAGWNIVPPTVMRGDAPLGAGSFQWFLEHDPEVHYLTLMEQRLEEFRVFAALDVVINNADRKAGHVLEDADGRVWAVDHGLTFNLEPKLRTVIWQFAQEPLGAAIRQDLGRLEMELARPGGLGDELTELLSPEESSATLTRTRDLLAKDHFPSPSSDRPLPWPLI